MHASGQTASNGYPARKPPIKISSSRMNRGSYQERLQQNALNCKDLDIQPIKKSARDFSNRKSSKSGGLGIHSNQFDGNHSAADDAAIKFAIQCSRGYSKKKQM